MPESDQFNDVSIDAGEEEGHVACGLEGADGYVTVLESEGRYEECDVSI